MYGDTTRTTWAAPLPIPVISDDTPELASPADVYTFTTTSAGEVISVTMESDDDAHLYLLGPASAGNPLVAEDDDSGPVSGTLDAQLAATLIVPGTYTLVAANNSMLLPPDPEEPGDLGDSIDYKLFIQKCPVLGALNPVTGFDVSQSKVDMVNGAHSYIGDISSERVTPFGRWRQPSGNR